MEQHGAETRKREREGQGRTGWVGEFEGEAGFLLEKAKRSGDKKYPKESPFAGHTTR